ncbi:beta-lactamase family protein [bacterium]|nr:beta-lactamase family protein [bacterium]
MRRWRVFFRTWVVASSLLFGLLSLGLTGCDDDSSSVLPAPDDELELALQTAVDSVLAVLELPGAAAMVVQPGEDGAEYEIASGFMVVDSFPTEDEWSGTPMDPSAFTRIGSVSKSFTAVLILHIAEQGLLELDTPVTAYLPDCPLPNADHVTVRHLLQMRSGWPEYLASDEFQSTWPPVEYSFDSIIALAASMGPALFAPGEQWMYCNTNYAVLGKIAEEVMGQRYGVLMRDYVLTPAGLTDTYSASHDGSMPSPYLHGYAPPGVIDAEWVETTDVAPDYVLASGNLVSTLADLQTWLSVIRDGGLLSAESMDQLWDTVPTGVNGFEYGMGVVDSPLGFGHNGSIVGYQTALYEWNGWRIAVMVNGNTRLDDPEHGVSADAVVEAIEAVLAEY